MTNRPGWKAIDLSVKFPEGALLLVKRSVPVYGLFTVENGALVAKGDHGPIETFQEWKQI